jgi:hypothetical protein
MHIFMFFFSSQDLKGRMRKSELGRAVAQAVSRWLPTAAAGSDNMGFVVNKLALG